jgi:hypothetical protein
MDRGVLSERLTLRNAERFGAYRIPGCPPVRVEDASLLIRTQAKLLACLLPKSFAFWSVSDSGLPAGSRQRRFTSHPNASQTVGLLTSKKLCFWSVSDSNRWPQQCHCCALPTELTPLRRLWKSRFFENRIVFCERPKFWRPGITSCTLPRSKNKASRQKAIRDSKKRLSQNLPEKHRMLRELAIS